MIDSITDGSIYAMLLTENKSEIQEVKPQTKCRPLDMAAMRHIGQNGRFKTSLVVLGEDGSLKVYDSSEYTDFWLSSRLRPQGDLIAISPKSSSKKSGSSGGRKGSCKQIKTTSGAPTFPVDFFEHSQALTDLEFGGNDLLQIYNVNQLKSRLNTSGKFVTGPNSV
jgi:E3 ubiquitin-protein ligase UBR4